MSDIKIDLQDAGFETITPYAPAPEKVESTEDKTNELSNLEQQTTASYPSLRTGQMLETFKTNELSPEKRRAVDSIKEQIKVLDNQQLLNYGSEAQTQLSKFSESILQEVQKQDVNDVGKLLDNLMKKLKEVDPDEINKVENSLFKKIFKKAQNSINDIMNKFQTTSGQISRIEYELENAKNILMQDVQMLDHLFAQNREYFDYLDLFIIAADEKRHELENGLLKEMEAKAQAANDSMDLQDLNDLRQYINRLDKKVYDLKLSRQITLQSAPQIRMIQDVNRTLAEKIQSSITTSIPLWRNQMSIALSLLHQQKASKAQAQVTATTNELLLKNSEMLKMNTIRTAQENERGIVEIETLKKTQQDIIEAIQETLKIQSTGTEKRRAAEIELAKMEEDLKTQLLNIKQSQGMKF